jgi:hypothetical protein
MPLGLIPAMNFITTSKHEITFVGLVQVLVKAIDPNANFSLSQALGIVVGVVFALISEYSYNYERSFSDWYNRKVPRGISESDQSMARQFPQAFHVVDTLSERFFYGSRSK